MILHINIVTLNNLDYLKNCINSINTVYKYKLRVIDQDSNDGTEQFCKENNIEYKKFSPRVSLSEAWNYGFKEALKDLECEYIFFPNNDVVFHEFTISNLIYALNNMSSNTVMVTGNNVAPIMDLNTMLNKKLEDFGDFNEDKKPINNWREEGPDFSCPMIKRKTLELIGYFDENFYPAYFEDNDYHLRIVKSGYHSKRISIAPYYHYGSMTMKNNPSLNVTSSRTERVFIEKWGAMPSACMDGHGYGYPYNDSSFGINDWRGSNVYKI